MSKRTLMLVVALVAALAIATTSTLAYLTSEDGAVNVMVVGNVEIEQNEEQRPEIGSTVLEDFEQFKPFFPGVYDEVTMEEDATQWPAPDGYEAAEGATGNEWQVYSNDIANVQDKFVTVENTGRNDAYVRTIIAVECPEGLDPELLHINDNADSTNLIGFTDAGFVELNGVRYMVYCYTYQDALAPGESTVPSLKQVLLDKLADNEDVALLGENFEILALSQGVQAEGFADADAALDEAFYDVSADASEEDVDALIDDLEQLLEEEYPGPTYITVTTADELLQALESASGETIIDATGVTYYIKTEEPFVIPAGVTMKNATIVPEYRGMNYVMFEGEGEKVVFDNCTFGTTSRVLVLGGTADGPDAVEYNICTFEGQVWTNFVENTAGVATFNDCRFTKAASSGNNYTQAMGGTHIFNACTFDYTGVSQTSMGVISSGCINVYSEDEYSTTAILNGCTRTNCGTRTYGPSSTLTIK